MKILLLIMKMHYCKRDLNVNNKLKNKNKKRERKKKIVLIRTFSSISY